MHFQKNHTFCQTSIKELLHGNLCYDTNYVKNSTLRHKPCTEWDNMCFKVSRCSIERSAQVDRLHYTLITTLDRNSTAIRNDVRSKFDSHFSVWKPKALSSEFG